MVLDNGPKNGDFASYVESLSLPQAHSRGRAHAAAPAVHDDNLHDDSHSLQAHQDSSGLVSETGAIRDPGSDPMFHASGKPLSSNRSETLASAFAAPARRAKSAMTDLLRAGRWALRIIALILIATGIFAVPLSVVPIIVGVFLLSLSFRQAGSRSGRGS